MPRERVAGGGGGGGGIGNEESGGKKGRGREGYRGQGRRRVSWAMWLDGTDERGGKYDQCRAVTGRLREIVGG